MVEIHELKMAVSVRPYYRQRGYCVCGGWSSEWHSTGDAITEEFFDDHFQMIEDELTGEAEAEAYLKGMLVGMDDAS